MNRLEREKIAGKIIRKLGVRKAKRGTQLPRVDNPHGYPGIDKLPNGKYRSRIRYCDALSGQDTRVTLGEFSTAEQAGEAYKQAHIHLWGSLSHFVKEFDISNL